MIFSSTYSTVNATSLLPTSGLVGTVGVRVISATGAVIVARSTAGITEPIAGTGFYVATINLTALSAAPAPGHYYVFWDDGAATPGHVTSEDLMLAKTTTLASALREIGNVSISHNASDINVGFFLS